MNECTVRYIQRVRELACQTQHHARALSGVFFMLALSGCGTLTPHYPLPATEGIDCAATLTQLDADIDRYAHFDPALHRIPGQPLLRSNRLAASYASTSLKGEPLRQWLQQMNTLAIDAYSLEFRRLPDNVISAWQARLPDGGLEGALHRCSKAFLANGSFDVEFLAENAEPPPNYSRAQRFWGIYPLVSRLASSGIEDYRREMTARITQGKSQHFQRYNHYVPAGAGAAKRPSTHSPALAALFAEHAPELWVEFRSSADLVGAPEWRSDSDIDVNTETPLAYTYVSQVRYKEQVLTQLNYVYWFSARPKTSWGDLYGGDLDGLVWRVTLNAQNKPVLYDTIHACGCYHVLFLPPGTEMDLDAIKDEKPLVFPLAAKAGRLRLKIDAGKHYLIDVDAADTEGSAVAGKAADPQYRRYVFEPYETLLVLPAPSGRRSLFGEDGIIAQSSRLERYVLWPLGVPNAGAMRQAGMHAIAFVGQRHFDEAWLPEILGIRFPE